MAGVHSRGGGGERQGVRVLKFRQRLRRRPGHTQIWACRFNLIWYVSSVNDINARVGQPTRAPI